MSSGQLWAKGWAPHLAFVSCVSQSSDTTWVSGQSRAPARMSIACSNEELLPATAAPNLPRASQASWCCWLSRQSNSSRKLGLACT